MITEHSVQEVMETASRNYHASALNHVASIVAYGAYHVIVAESAGSLEIYRRKARNILLAQDLTYKTAARQVSFAFDVVSMIRRKFIEHARVAELKDASDGNAAFDAMLGFMTDMGIQSAADASLWAEGDGTMLTTEARATLRALPTAEAEAAKLSPVQQKLAKATARVEKLQKAADAETTEPDVAETTQVDVERYLMSCEPAKLAEIAQHVIDLCEAETLRTLIIHANERLTLAKREEIARVKEAA